MSEEYFATIDTPLKSYILGLVSFNKVSITDADTATSDADILNVSIPLNNIKYYDNNMRSISYGYYSDLNEDDKKNYPYFNNIDRLAASLRNIGTVKYTDTTLTGTLELSITSQKIKDDINSHLKDEDNRDTGVEFYKAYIEKYGSIINDHLNITFYDEKMADSISKLYDIPHNILKGVNNQVIQYKGVNMIDFLGMIYSDYDCPYYNNYIYSYNNQGSSSGGSGSDAIPTIKVFKVDERAIVPSKSRYSDSGYDLTIISEYKRLTTNTVIYDTGIQLEIPNGYYVEIVPRSSISRSGYILANNVGIIDQGYRGNLYVALTKINEDVPELSMPWRCCQMIVKKQVYSRLEVVSSGGAAATPVIETSSRGSGAFGSTG